MSQLVQLPSASVCIPPDPQNEPDPLSERAQLTSVEGAPCTRWETSGESRNAESGRPSRCPRSESKGKRVSANSTGIQLQATPTLSSQHGVSSPSAGQTSPSCPFAAVLPSSRQPVAITAPDGTVVHVRRKCPAWIRVLRFTAKYVARTVLTRTAKSLLMTAFHTARRGSRRKSSVSSMSSSNSVSAESDSEFGSDAGSESESES